MIGSVVSNIQSVVVFVAVLSVLIIVHEWGHFITAKRLGVDVKRFALGFGPTLFSKVYNGTTYMINAIPLGGYVKMAGDDRMECKGTSGEFYSKPIGHRSLVVLNGPVVNFLLAYISFIFVFMIGYPGQSTTIAELVDGGPAQVAGLRAGDKIIAVDSREVHGWLNLQWKLEGENPKRVEITVLRDGKETTLTVIPEITEKPNLVGRPRMIRDLGIDNMSNVIGGLVEEFPAENAGLQGGDRIIEIDNQEITSWTDIKGAVADSTGKQIVLKLVRDGQILVKAIKPRIDEHTDENGQTVKIRKIGIGPQQELDLYKFGIWASLVHSGEELVYITQLTYESLYQMVIGSKSARESVTGPVGIFYIVKGAAQEGVSHLLFILGVISASLAIFNLLPVIPLDGGHLFLFGIEKVRGKPLPPKIDEYIARLGFGLIILLALFVFYSDFSRFGWIDNISGWFTQVRKMFP
ncbi:MAG: RIP metalloprotease RseP [Candidatus Omnitrophica bacterium]|nr:RIP metalloprotease RseP [Candidatus Omnitrophota bacterium]